MIRPSPSPVRTVAATLRLLAAAVTTVACAPPWTTIPAYAPQPECDSVVVAHRANPAAAVDQEPEVAEIRLPPNAPRVVRGKSYTLKFVVSEDGTIDPASIEIPLALPPEYAAHLRQSLARWRFEPARAGECRVPATYANLLRP
ncbi:MAG TPA: hypothetical protein VF092_10130 [Longimicrobium sp.]